MTSSRHLSRWVVVSLVVGGVPLGLAACGTSAGDGSGSGGVTSTGGSSGSGGAATSGAGGQAAGGTGGATTGGATTGGATTGGATTGGVTTGGANTGGTGTGGTAPGGSSSGGASGATGGGGMGASSGTGGSTTTGGAGTGGASGGSGGACPTSTTLKSGDTNMTLTVGGMERSFIVHAPPSYNGTTRMPVVFDFHGLGGTASGWRRGSRWASYGDSQGFITVFPQGLPNMTGGSPGWNAGGCCVTVADDVAFVRAMITHLESNACVDSKRIHATGCSNGGAMSYMLACNAADVIASVAPVDFDCVVGNRCMQCNAGRPITEIQFRATNDSAVNYSGAVPNFERWGQINMCTGTAAPLPANAACQTYPMCASGAETILCTQQGGSHCGNYTSLMIPETAWEVLKRHPLP